MQVDEHIVRKVLLNPPKLHKLGLSMMVTRLAAQYARTPTPDVLRSAIREINKFLRKFSGMLTRDYETLVKLRG